MTLNGTKMRRTLTQEPKMKNLNDWRHEGPPSLLKKPKAPRRDSDCSPLLCGRSKDVSVGSGDIIMEIVAKMGGDCSTLIKLKSSSRHVFAIYERRFCQAIARGILENPPKHP